MKAIRKLDRAVPGSTLVETIVSMVILLSVLGLFFTQIGRMEATVNPYLIIRAYEISQQVLLSDDLLVQEGEEREIDGFVVRKKIREEANTLYYVEILVLTPAGREIYKRTKWISANIEF